MSTRKGRRRAYSSDRRTVATHGRRPADPGSKGFDDTVHAGSSRTLGYGALIDPSG